MGDEPATRDYFRIADISAASARPDPAVYGNDPLIAAYPLTWDGPNGVFLAREVDGEILLIAGACRALARAEAAVSDPSLENIDVHVFESLDDADARAFHDASNIYTAATPAADRRKLLMGFREHVKEMGRRSCWRYGKMTDLCSIVTGKSTRFVSEMATLTDRLTPRLLQCFDSGSMGTAVARKVASLRSRSGGDSLIGEFDAYARRLNPACPADYADVYRRFEREKGGPYLLAQAAAALSKAADAFERNGSAPDADELAKVRAAFDRLNS